jgi:hypothetical protein
MTFKIITLLIKFKFMKQKCKKSGKVIRRYRDLSVVVVVVVVINAQAFGGIPFTF